MFFNLKISMIKHLILVTLTVSFHYKSYVRTLFLMSELEGNAPPSLSHVTWGCGVPVTWHRMDTVSPSRADWSLLETTIVGGTEK